ncbi:uroporphyrinogen-III synthase [Gemmatimonas aurantiaca]|nr:uroporphyrinogen-III synthase [Gemmatimonas aurantiaca]
MIAPRDRLTPLAGAMGSLLAGVRIAVTRTVERGGPLADALRRVGATVHEIPLTHIEPLDAAPLHAALRELAHYDWVLLTSVNAVERLAQAVREVGAESVMESRRLAVVGSTTAAACESHGWRLPTVQPERMQAEGVLDDLASRSDVEGSRVLYPAAAGARDVLPEGLRALGAVVDVIATYRTVPDAAGQERMLALVESGEVDLVTLAAPSAMDALLDALPPERASRLPVACIGPVTARAARLAGFPVKVESTAPTVEGWVRSIVQAYASRSTG